MLRDDPTPTRVVARAVRAPHGASSLEIDWSTGETSCLPHWILRGFCPCADCQGHVGPLCYVAGTDTLERAALELREIVRVGNYALRLVWGDGHQAGLYSFEHLRWLGSLSHLEPAEAREQRAGR